ncbi:signal peptidase I [Micromonospora sp. NPDC049044]|uniref:signal peptidase I n=1 Tax=unclassified Micromonospora TaxID=2617518 RepID=UPI00340B7873
MVFAVLSGLVVLVLGGLLIWLRRGWALITVEGQSMAPTLRPGERVLVRRVPAASIKTGEMVVVERPVDGGWRTTPLAAGTTPLAGRKWIVKRAVAGPGDPVPTEFRASNHDDDGAAAGGVPDPTGGSALVPPGHYLLLGDNRHNSVDSRMFGFVPGTRILGPVRRGTGPT